MKRRRRPLRSMTDGESRAARAGPASTSWTHQAVTQSCLIPLARQLDTARKQPRGTRGTPNERLPSNLPYAAPIHQPVYSCSADFTADQIAVVNFTLPERRGRKASLLELWDPPGHGPIATLLAIQCDHGDRQGGINRQNNRSTGNPRLGRKSLANNVEPTARALRTTRTAFAPLSTF